MRVGLRTRRGAYLALALLTLLWAANWPAMKFALNHSPPIAFNLQRTSLAVAVLFAVLIAQRRPLWPSSWLAVAVTGFFQTTVNFGSTTMAIAGSVPGRTSVLVFTMPFWTLLIAFIAWQMLLGVIPLTLLPLAIPQPSTDWSVAQVLLLVYVAVISTALGFLLWNEILRFLPAGTASLNMFTIPVIVMVMSMIVFDERLTPVEWIGIACIGAGLLIITWLALRAARGGAPPMPDPTPADGG